MPEQNLSQTRVVDPILSTHARGYRQAEMIGHLLLPYADVGMYGGQVIEFDDSAFDVYNTVRAPGTNIPRVIYGHSGKPYAIIPSGLQAVVPRQRLIDGNAVPGIDLKARGVNVVLRAHALAHEVRCATLVLNDANYDNDHKVTLAAGAEWSHANSDPAGDIETGKEAIRQSIGIYPNTLMLPAAAMKNCRTNASLLDRASSVNIKKINLDALKQIFEVDSILVGAAVAKSAGVKGDVWGTSAVLAYVSPGAQVDANIEEPSFGYSYRIQGMPMVEPYRWDADSDSWVATVHNDATPVLAGMGAGYLIKRAGL
jgi:hypothetical protein